MKKNKILETNGIYNRALIGGEFGIWEWNIAKNTVFLSEQCYKIIGYVDEKLKNLYECIDKFVVSQDIEIAINDLDSFINGNTSLYKSEVRILTKNRKVRWIVIKGKYTKDIDGKENLVSGSINDITIKKELEGKVETLTYYNALTGLPNKTLFMIDLKSVINECKGDRNKAALLFIDVDNFKLVNNNFGYDYGDMYLKILSQALLICNNDNCNTYHLNGDDFIILANKINSKDEVNNICKKIMEYCNKPFELMGEQIHVSVSIGVIFIPKDTLDINDIYKYLDLTMHQSKIKGKSRVTFFEKSILDNYSRKLIIEQELKSAISNKEFFIVYQPQIDMLQHKVIGFEALLRWNNNKLGNVSPAEFIPIAEKCGSIIKIGQWVINSVCNKISKLCEKGYDFGIMSVNVSPTELKRTDFVSKLTSILESKNISPSMLEIEITEGALIDFYKDNIDIYNKIVEKGIKIAIDDFGTGYSSLNYLTNLSISTLKIDKSFIDGIDKEKNIAIIEKNMAVIDCILNLSKVMKYKVIAEGVETKFQMKKLLNAGSNIIQGYYFSKPVAEEEVESMLVKI